MKSFFGSGKSEPAMRSRPAGREEPAPEKRQRHEPEDEDDQAIGREASDEQSQEDEDDRQDDRNRPDEREQRSRQGNGKSRPRMSGSAAARKAMEHLAQLTGQTPESISGLKPTDQGGWKVSLDIVELERIPRTTDVMGSYEVELDEQGELVGYKRLTRYYRNQVDER